MQQIIYSGQMNRKNLFTPNRKINILSIFSFAKDA